MLDIDKGVRDLISVYEEGQHEAVTILKMNAMGYSSDDILKIIEALV